jgi:ubiquinone/menaquinone biosynthesis C-methylase UbiE
MNFSKFEAFAAREPYFSVLTSPKFLRANLSSEHEAEFFDSGQEIVDWIFDVVDQRISPHFAPMSVLEYGSGIGRLAIPLAKRPGQVTAVDRSPTMLDLARREAEKRGAAHIEFLTPSQLFSSTRTFDLISCFSVLQWLRPDEGLALLKSLLARIASGGIGVFHMPFATRANRLVRFTRWTRDRLPLVNGVTNLARGKPFGDPFIPSHTYDLDEVLRLCETMAIPATHIVFEHERELTSAIVFAEVPLPSTTGRDNRGRPLPGTTLQVQQESGRMIDVKNLIAESTIEDLNRAAERYFASLSDWEEHLAKPFSRPAEMSSVLANVATLLHGLQLTPGMTVVEFGAGTGWLSRWLSQLGCRVILLDVSPTALRIARELYARTPVIGDRPPPEFLEFDGRHIALPDASVDRVLSFDAFHHVANPDAVIGELGRILKPGGLAGFVEPGARHSRAPMSQFEMRNYGVVENDIDVHAIWRVAQQSGFVDLKMALFQGPPLYVSPAEYADFLAGGQTTERWLTAGRIFLRHVRSFLLIKEGSEPTDSRGVEGLACEIDATLTTGRIMADGAPVVDVVLRNTGRARWLRSDAEYGGVNLGAHLYDASRHLLEFDFHLEPLSDVPRDVEPGETIRLRVTLPSLPPGQYHIEFDCVASRVTWFAQIGSKPATVIAALSRNQRADS